MNQYSFLKGLQKAATQGIIWLAPLLLLQFPEVSELSISAVVALVVNYLKVKNAQADF